MKAAEVENSCFVFLTGRQVIIFGWTPVHIEAMAKTLEIAGYL
jgi:hypothetical protein